MAAGRFNIPTILVMCGYQPSGHYEGKHVDIEDVFLGSVQAMFGKLSKETLRSLDDEVRDYASDFFVPNPWGKDQPTWRQMASQQAGLPRDSPCKKVRLLFAISGCSSRTHCG